MSSAANVPVLVEVAVESVTGALAAAAGGALRIELCPGLDLGGLTPSLGLLEAVKAAVTIPVFAMIRPRGGDFLYDDGEFATMCRDLTHLRRAGADGFVTGMLSADGRVDEARLQELIGLAEGRPLTFHRAIDVAADAALAIDSLKALGVARVLTSGQAGSALDGAATIRAMVQRAAGRLVVMAGVGVDDRNVRQLLTATGVREVHLSATARTTSGMSFRRAGVAMGSARPTDEYAQRRTDGDLVARIVAAVAG